jgi:hypothetical protein
MLGAIPGTKLQLEREQGNSELGTQKLFHQRTGDSILESVIRDSTVESAIRLSAFQLLCLRAFRVFL